MFDGQIDQRMWELYTSWCTQNHVQPKVKGFILWLEERY